MKQILILLFIFTISKFHAQQKVGGIVSNKINLPLENVLIRVQNSNLFTVTDSSGVYEIMLPEGVNILEFSKSDYRTQIHEITKNTLNVSMTLLSDINILELSLDELTNIKVVSVSKIEEVNIKAPANIRVITKAEIQENGYMKISDIFKNLPGFDFTTTYGSEYFHNYMRGFRSYIGSYYMILVDGLSFDDLWFQDDKILDVIPISNIERIEIVYGPSSSIYGVSALMGVVNIITKSNLKNDGLAVNGTISSGFNSYFNTDLNVFCKKEDFRYSLTARIEDYNVNDLVDNNAYEWTKDKYITDTSLWGGVLESPTFGGGFSSLVQNKSIDGRMFYKNTEMGFQYYFKDPGQGLYSALDQVRSQIRFNREAKAAYIKHSQILIGKKLGSTTVLRYRTSSTLPDAPFLYASNEIVNDSTQRMVNITLYQSLNASWAAMQDFNFNPSSKLTFVGGFFYERKNLQRDYETVSGSSVNVKDFDFNTYDYPTPMPREYKYGNRMFQSERGAYGQGSWMFFKNTTAVFGLRYNNNTQFGNIIALRGALVSQIRKWNIKILYGEGQQAPAPRLLYGNWSFQGINKYLKPITARTSELNISRNTAALATTLSAYYITCNNSIIQTSKGAENVGKKQVFGVDLFLKTNINDILLFKRISLWVNYGFIKAKGEEAPIYDDPSSPTKQIIGFQNDELGDIADHKIFAGVTFYYRENISLLIRMKTISKIKTIYSNPIRTLDPYTVFDANINVLNIEKTGLGLQLGIENISNIQYFTPGVGDANAGETPGYWDKGIWYGSKGYYNSKIPQTLRFFRLSLVYNFK